MKIYILSILKKFWPHRSKAKGFSIEKIAFQYREKISSLTSGKTSNQPLEEINLISLEKDSNHIDIAKLSTKRVHWANRDFSEYREVA